MAIASRIHLVSALDEVPKGTIELDPRALRKRQWRRLQALTSPSPDSETVALGRVAT